MNKKFYNAGQTVARIVMIAATLVVWADSAGAFDQFNKTIFGVAIKGYDSVAYHTENRAVKGKREFSYRWNDALWYFVSAANRDAFISDPERYAPQYGGY